MKLESERAKHSFPLDDIITYARTTPDKQAIVSTSKQTTFGQLLTHAMRLAAQMAGVLDRRRGIVAVCTSDPHALAVAALATWKLRCAYLPIDPLGPVQRNRRILADANPALIVSENPCDHLLSVGNVPVLTPNPDSSLSSISWDSSEKSGLQSDDIAYVIYTSGSTGQPKGVEVTQSNLRHLVQWYRHTFGVTSQDIGTQFAPLTFDASVLEFWPMLACGITLHVPDRPVVLNPEALRDFLLQKKITISFAATALAEALLELPWPSECSLRYLLTGGDALRTYPRAELPFHVVNNYGPTECTVLSTSGIVPLHCGELDQPSIGLAIPGAEIFILDSKLQPVGNNIRGQIAIGGDGVAAGYRGNPELTKERFKMNCWSGAPRLYLSGDLGRRLPDGTIEFCGRIDDQVKMFGYRIEPGEIVAALCSHPSISAAAVTVIEGDGRKQMIASIVAGSEPLDADIREYLRPLLPSFMIPDRFLRMSELPVAANGSPDRGTVLTAYNKAEQNRVNAIEALRTEIEGTVSGIVSSIIKGVTLGPQDNFFRVGGHSLLAARILAQLRREFRLNLELRAVFEHPTIAGLAREIERQVLTGFSAPGSTGPTQALPTNEEPQCQRL